MTYRPPLVRRFLNLPLIRHALTRRLMFIGVMTVLALLTLFPERYRASMTLTPTDPGSLGLGGALGQLGAMNTVFNNAAAIEVSLRVARSLPVRDEVIRKLQLEKRWNMDNVHANRRLDRILEIRALRGGIIEAEVVDRDPQLGMAIVKVFSDATRARLGEIARQQTAYKRDVLEKLVGDGYDRLAKAQSAYDDFRLKTRYSQPGSSIEEIGSRIPRLEAAIKTKEVDLQARRQFYTDDNMIVRQIVAELKSLNEQLQDAKATSPTNPDSVGRVVRQSTEAINLQRELSIARGLYDGYRRFLDGTSVEDLTSTATLRVLEPPYIDPDRQINWAPLVLLVFFGMFGAAVEVYALRPPVGDGERKA